MHFNILLEPGQNQSETRCSDLMSNLYRDAQPLRNTHGSMDSFEQNPNCDGLQRNPETVGSIMRIFMGRKLVNLTGFQNILGTELHIPDNRFRRRTLVKPHPDSHRATETGTETNGN